MKSETIDESEAHRIHAEKRREHLSTGYPERSTIRVSLLDRLIDNEPENSNEAPLTDKEKLRIIQQSVRRDLENLLNTRYRCIAWPPEFEQIDDSLINYGIPDFTASSLNAAEEGGILIKAIHKAITLFENRLVDVRVTPVTNEYHYDRTFRFRIEGMLLVEDGQHPVKFDSSMESTTGQFDIE